MDGVSWQNDVLILTMRDWRRARLETWFDVCVCVCVCGCWRRAAFGFQRDDACSSRSGKPLRGGGLGGGHQGGEGMGMEYGGGGLLLQVRSTITRPRTLGVLGAEGAVPKLCRRGPVEARDWQSLMSERLSVRGGRWLLRAKSPGVRGGTAW